MNDEPRGMQGPIQIGQGGARWILAELPGDKAEREQLVADLFVRGSGKSVAMESDPSLRAFGKPLQNK